MSLTFSNHSDFSSAAAYLDDQAFEFVQMALVRDEPQTDELCEVPP